MELHARTSVIDLRIGQDRVPYLDVARLQACTVLRNNLCRRVGCESACVFWVVPVQDTVKESACIHVSRSRGIDGL